MGFEQIEVELQEVMGNDRSIANAAWTSSYSLRKKETKTDEDVKNVIHMLLESDPAHGVPIESVIFRFWIRMPIACDRQWMTHRMASHNGMSGRYRTMPDDFYYAPADVEALLEKLDNDDQALASGIWNNWLQEYNHRCEHANLFYRSMVDRVKKAQSEGRLSNDEMKRLREFFRGVLPQHAMTERTTVMNLRSFSNIQKQRNDSHAQPEIRHVAQLMLRAVEESGQIPITLECLKAVKWRV